MIASTQKLLESTMNTATQSSDNDELSANCFDWNRTEKRQAEVLALQK